MAAMAGSRAAAVRKVPLRGGCAPSDLGNISYQAENPASSRSTISRHGPERVAVSRSAVRCISANDGGRAA